MATITFSKLMDKVNRGSITVDQVQASLVVELNLAKSLIQCDISTNPENAEKYNKASARIEHAKENVVVLRDVLVNMEVEEKNHVCKKCSDYFVGTGTICGICYEPSEF